MKAIIRQIRITSKKLNLVADMVRGKMVQEALDIMRFTPKKAAKILYKAIKSAAANAKENNKQGLEDLKIKEIVVTESTTFKRSVPISRGRMHPILKRNSHLTIKVETTVTKAEKTK
ncbi:50S ribosomal protein L22 [Candidatus Peregrinibacteria bacterium CG_4_10_14_0_2_um_filter_38_24]|nr:MAG: 50S ribosomal protein L22 [Candidatus Peregrinibacteria bacterium CG_4_10_14_0_2_um_filter_38_24]PJC38614.1 MAG: 50S ribosomal protein L22 [Candidatus Peregrinibacteria bacterium CG_4_9_14_0_2_um_filter_38_9]